MALSVVVQLNPAFLLCHAISPTNGPQHKPGKQVGDDAAPEFHVKVLPAGSAPAKDTFQPNPEVDGQKVDPSENKEEK